jgi:hypothetical protein
MRAARRRGPGSATDDASEIAAHDPTISAEIARRSCIAGMHIALCRAPRCGLDRRADAPRSLVAQVGRNCGRNGRFRPFLAIVAVGNTPGVLGVLEISSAAGGMFAPGR